MTNDNVTNESEEVIGLDPGFVPEETAAAESGVFLSPVAPAVFATSSDIEEEKANNGDLGAGQSVPEGYRVECHFGFVNDPTEHQASDLLGNVVIENPIDGVSVAVDSNGTGFGIIHGRIIHDFLCRAYVLRKDDRASNTTYLRVSLSHNAS